MDWLIAPDANKFPATVVLGDGSQPLLKVLSVAAHLIAKGDTVYFAPGTYHLPLQDAEAKDLTSWDPSLEIPLATLKVSYTTFALIPEGLNGTPDSPITFEGILDADGNMPTIDGRGYFRSCAFRVNGSHLTFRNFRIIGCQIGFHINGGPAKDGIRIENCEVGEYGTATKRLTVFYQDPNNAAVTSVTPNVLAKPPIAGDSDDNYPLGVECDWSTSNLTIANCYFHDLGSTETEDLAAITDGDLRNGWISHYFSHGHALYLWGTGHLIKDCLFARIAQGYAIKCDGHGAVRDALGLPIPPETQLSSGWFPWASHLVIGCQFKGGIGPEINPQVGALAYILPKGTSSDAVLPPGYAWTGANVALVLCDFFCERPEFAVVSLPAEALDVGQGIALVRCRLFATGGTPDPADSQFGLQIAGGHWTIMPELFQLTLAQVTNSYAPHAVYMAPGLVATTPQVQVRVTEELWQAAFGTDKVVLSADPRASHLHLYGRPYPGTGLKSDPPDKLYGWDGPITKQGEPLEYYNVWVGASPADKYDNVLDEASFAFVDCERRYLAEWPNFEKPWSLPAA